MRFSKHTMESDVKFLERTEEKEEATGSYCLHLAFGHRQRQPKHSNHNPSKPQSLRERGLLGLRQQLSSNNQGPTTQREITPCQRNLRKTKCVSKYWRIKILAVCSLVFNSAELQLLTSGSCGHQDHLQQQTHPENLHYFCLFLSKGEQSAFLLCNKMQ